MTICQSYDELMRDYHVNQRRPCTDVEILPAVRYDFRALPHEWDHPFAFNTYAAPAPRCLDPIDWWAHAAAYMALSVTKGCQ